MLRELKKGWEGKEEGFDRGIMAVELFYFQFLASVTHVRHCTPLPSENV